MTKATIEAIYTEAARQTNPDLCCGVDYRSEFDQKELDHIPAEVLDRNYGCGVPPGLRRLEEGKNVLDLGPGLGRDCFVAARKVGPGGHVFGVDMNPDMLARARGFQHSVEVSLGYSNIEFLEGQFDVEIPLTDDSVDIIFSNCVNNLAVDKKRAYAEMFRVLRPGSKLSFSDIVSYASLPELLRTSDEAWAGCVAGVLSFSELKHHLREAGFHAICLKVDYLWKTGEQVALEYFSPREIEGFSQSAREELSKARLYSVAVEAHKPLLDPDGPCYFKGQYAVYHGPAAAMHLDDDPDHIFTVGEPKEVCEKTATILKSPAFAAHFTVFEPEGDVEARACVPGAGCC